MKIYSIGCSFTHGDELQSPSTSAWPMQLAQKLGATGVNDAVSGGTNYRTVYRTIKHLSNSFDLYIIAWTTNTRFTFYKSDNNFEINFNPQLVNKLYKDQSFYRDWGKTLYANWFNELYAFKLWLQQIIQLQAVIKKPYLMINTMDNHLKNWLVEKNQFINSVKWLINFDIMSDDEIFDEYQEIQYYVSCIETEKFYRWNNFSITDLCTQFPCGAGGHILELSLIHI